MLLQMVLFHYFLWMSNSPVCVCVCIDIYIHHIFFIPLLTGIYYRELPYLGYCKQCLGANGFVVELYSFLHVLWFVLVKGDTSKDFILGFILVVF